jgi:hypothetical protein
MFVRLLRESTKMTKDLPSLALLQQERIYLSGFYFLIFNPAFRTSQVSHYEFSEFGEIELAMASLISHLCV